ncbi:MAG: hydrogenase expression/formation protein HypE [Thermoflexales bacterium]|nr:hydrogenase expression/formation protein HypE [Thermoflexales bacterium]MDW8350733.1 hydrogenase expression/formation protein HypE [Anaerolineae bacterium]
MSLDFTQWSCPLPLRDYPNIVVGHGGGGKLTTELIQHLFAPAFDDPALHQRGDAAVLPLDGARLAISTDSFVVRPLFFPGGSIGELAVNGTINDLAMMGAQPRYLTAGFIVEEGLPLAQLGVIVERMAAAARAAGVRIVAGDTKVVDKGHGDGVFINTTGIGVIPDGVSIGPDRARPGDGVLINGSIGDHGMAIMSVREGLQFETTIASDTAPLHGLVAAMLEAAPGAVHVLRDPTRGGLAAALNEIAVASRVGIQIDERALPVSADVQAACELLGIDPIYVANEGKLVAFVAQEAVETVLACMRAHPLGRGAAVIGRVVEQPAGLVTARTAIGGARVIPMPLGEQLPRIC